MENNIVIGIEGLVGAGKTSICRKLIQMLPNSVLLNGGNLYRAIVYSMMSHPEILAKQKEEKEPLDIKKMMDLFQIKIKIEEGETQIYIQGEKADEEKLQSKEASLAVSKVGGKADNRNLFLFAKNLIDELKKNYLVIISGRSVMKIYPETDFHFFITASIDERVRRKCIQYKKEVKEEEVRNNILQRDELQKQAGFYEIYEKTKIIDVTDCKNVEESTKKVLEHLKLLTSMGC